MSQNESSRRESVELPLTTSDMSALGNKELRRIGNYRLLHIIGEGGMGQVWMAEQEQPVKRRVALKLIKTGQDCKPVIARFEAERQAIALMDHPSIAKIFDGGTTEDGQPFFVMELVQGISITQYCDRNKLNLRSRLSLFVQVCNAVQHAHQKGVIHRDIKPSNILVSPTGDVPIAKVIDFGLAKALDSRSKLTDKTLFTEFGAVVGTLQYMSPEAAELTALDVDTRSDVYSLGVLLYELLTGSTPIDSDSLRKLAILKVLETIRDEDPPRPSDRLSSSGNLVPISQNRQIESSRLQQELRGDLDWVVMKALEKDRTRRYETANNFAADVQRYLDDQPVVARPPSTVYKLRKFVKKNRVLVVGSLGMITILVVGLIGTLLGLREARVQMEIAKQATHNAESAAQEAEIARKLESEARLALEGSLSRAVSAEQAIRAKASELQKLTEFQSSQLSSINVPKMALRLRESLENRYSKRLMDKNTEASEMQAKIESLHNALEDVSFVDVSLDTLKWNILEPTRGTVRESYSDQPEFASKLLATLGAVSNKLGDWDFAMDTTGEAIDLLSQNLGRKNPTTLSAISQMAGLLRTKGKLDECTKLYREVLESRRQILGNENSDTIHTMVQLASALKLAKKTQEAQDLLVEAYEFQRKLLGEENLETLVTADSLASILESQGKLLEAITIVKDTTSARRRALGVRHKDTINSMLNLACSLNAIQKTGDADALFAEVLEALGESKEAEYAGTISRISNKFFGGLVDFLVSRGRGSDAQRMFQERIEYFRAQRGEDHVVTTNEISNMLTFLGKQHNLSECERLNRRLLDTYLRTLGSEHLTTGLTKLDLAQVLTEQGEYFEAEQLCREALPILKSRFDEDNFTVRLAMHAIGTSLYFQRRYAEAIEYLRPSIRGTDLVSVAAISELFDSYKVLSQRQEMVATASSLKDLVIQNCSSNPQLLQHTLRCMADSMNQVGAYDESEVLLRQAIDVSTAAKIDGWQLARLKLALGVSLMGQDQRDNATPLIKESNEIILKEKEMIPETIKESVFDETQRALKCLEKS